MDYQLYINQFLNAECQILNVEVVSTVHSKFDIKNSVFDIHFLSYRFMDFFFLGLNTQNDRLDLAHSDLQLRVFGRFF